MEAPRKILLIRPDRLGDLILSLPVAETLKKNIPGSEIHYLAASYTAAIAPMVDYVDGWILDTDEDGRRLSTGKLAQKIKSGGFDCLIELKSSWRTAAAGFLSGVRLRVGTSRRAYSLFYTRRINIHRKASGYHQTELELMHLLPFGFDNIVTEPHIQVTRSGREKAGLLLNTLTRSFVVIHPGSGGSSPNWSVEKYRELAALIKKELDFEIVITDRAEQKSGFENCIDLAGKTDLETLAGVIARAAVFISGSTGPMHLADAIGTPCVSILSNRADIGPERWGPRRSKSNVIVPSEPCRCPDLEKCRCLDRITSAEVLNVIRGVINSDIYRGANRV